MSLQQSDVKKIAHLARIAVEKDETAGLAGDLSSILDFVEQMSSVDTDGITPMAHPLHMVQRLRDDRVTETDLRERYQSVAPSTEAGLYLVPRVID
jgi:aspartyl-tRNA(Asn)/glutamyl-tRNA(Gln) amidotransferase subunit C